MEKHELSKIDFELIDDAFKALLQSRPDPVTADKIADLRNVFRDAYTGWLEIEKEDAWSAADCALRSPIGLDNPASSIASLTRHGLCLCTGSVERSSALYIC